MVLAIISFANILAVHNKEQAIVKTKVPIDTSLLASFMAYMVQFSPAR